MILATATLFFSACNSDTQNIRFGSGNKGGVYDTFANTFAEHFNKANSDIQVQAKNTAGSHANIRLIEEGFIDLGIVQSDVLNDYLMRSRKRHAIAAIGGLYTESIQIVVSADSDIKTINDLQNRKVSVGEEESGVVRNAEIILEANGISFDKIQKVNLGFKESAAALKANEIDAFFCTAGIPTPYISGLASSKNIRLISMDSASINRVINLHPELTASEIPAGTYAGQAEAAQTLGVKAILVANQTLYDDVVKKVSAELFHKDVFSAPLTMPTPEFATSNIPVGFHPGAAAFYASKNIVVEKAEPLQARGPIPSTGD